MQLEADLVMELEVELGEVQEVGNTPKGYLRLIPIVGGTFTGPNIKGRVLTGGYDWNTSINAHISHAFAKYTIQTDDGAYISIENEGYLDSRNEGRVITTTPRFFVADGKYSYLESGVFVGSIEAGQASLPSVFIKIYKMR